MGTCKKIAEMIGAYIYGDLSPVEMRTVRLHAEECEACSSEIEERIRTISLIPADVPVLSDEDRRRVMWTVKGAIKAKCDSQRFILFRPSFARGFALAAVILAAFVGGAFVGYSKIPPKVKVIVKKVPVERDVPDVSLKEKTVKYAENPEPTSSKPVNDVAMATQPFVRYNLQGIYRGGNIDRGSEKPMDALNSIIGDNQTEPESDQLTIDYYVLPALPPTELLNIPEAQREAVLAEPKMEKEAPDTREDVAKE